MPRVGCSAAHACPPCRPALPCPRPARLVALPCPAHALPAGRQGVKSVLQQCYGDPAAVDDELVDIILKPGERSS